jgi:hypothetical protein
MPDRFGTFYPIWPILDGKPLNYQWGEVRLNTAETKAVVRNSFQELETDVDELNAQRALLGLAFGDLIFSKKYRFFYNKATFDLCCQRNTGTVASPIWVDAFCVRYSDGQFQAVGEGGIRSAAGFYGPGLQSIEEVAESGSSADVSIRNPTKIFFNADDGFGVQPISSGANAGQPEIRFTQPFGRAQVFPKTGRVWQVDHNFGVTPVMAQVMDNDDVIVIPGKADLSNPNTAWFYFDAVFAGKAYIASGGLGAHSLVPRDPFYLVIRTQEQDRSTHTFKPNADLVFDARFFYVNVDMDPAHGGAHKSAFVSLHSGGGGGVTAHGALTGLGPPADDHPQYLLVDGTRAMTGDLNMGGNDVRNAHAGTFSDRVLAEAFYLESGSGGEFSKRGNDVLIKSKDGDVFIDDDLTVSGSIRSEDKVTAEAFYLINGGELLPNGQLDHGALQGLADNDHPQYLLRDGSAAMTGDLNLGGKDVLNAAAGIFTDKVRAEAFYLETGGELITGIDVSRGTQLFDNKTELNFNPDHFYVTTNSRGAPSISLNTPITPSFKQTFDAAGEWQVQHNLGVVPVLWNVFDTEFSAFIPEKVDVSNPNLAYFYFTTPVAGTALVAGGAGGLAQIIVRESDNTPPAFVSNELVFNSENFYLDATSVGKPQVNLRPRIYGQVGAFTKQQFFVPPNLSIGGGNVSWNLDDAQVGTLRLSSSATLQNPTGIRTGGQYTLIVTQVGGNTLSFGTAYKFGDAGAPTLSTSAGLRDVLVFMGFGSEMFLVGVSTGF